MTGRKNAPTTRGRPFGPDHPGRPFGPGNPGRPKGARNKATLAAEALLDGEVESITRKAIELAKAGDMSALRLCLDRILPVRRDRPVAFELPILEHAGDAVSALAAIAKAVADGDLTPMEAAELSKVIDGFVRAIETTELADRLDRLEQAQVRGR
jgi:hypothetical protein